MRWLSMGLCWILLAGCSAGPARETGLPSVAATKNAQQAAPENQFPNWPMPPHEIERLVNGHHFVGEGISRAGGTTGARKVELFFSSLNRTIAFKWKPMQSRPWYAFLPGLPGRLDGINNSPRKEYAAWKVQALFLDPDDYVVPTAVPFCAPLAHYRELDPAARSTLKGSECVLGTLAVWLVDVEIPEQLFDPQRFAADPVYAAYLADFNLLTYLIAHHDGRKGNFLVARDPARRQVFAIDNGVAFGGIFYNWFVPNWNRIRVPGLRRKSVERLRTADEQTLKSELAVVAELHLGPDRTYVSADPGVPLDEDDGVRIKNDVLQFGLTDDEIEDVHERIEELLADVDAGTLPVF